MKPGQGLAHQLFIGNDCPGKVRSHAFDGGDFKAGRIMAQMRRKLGGRVEAVTARVMVGKGLDHDAIGLLFAVFQADFAPARQGGRHVGQQLGVIDEQHRPPLHPDIAGIGKVAQQIPHDGPIILRAVFLVDQDFLVHAVPAAGPIFVGPVQAKRHVVRGVRQEPFQGQFQQPLAGKPVVVEAKAVDAMLFGHGDLPVHDFRHAQVVKSQRSGQVGLVVIREKGRGPGHVGPLGKALAPPPVVFRNRVELGQVVGQQFDPPGRRLQLVLGLVGRIPGGWPERAPA